jgi:hypothetical protein
MISSTVNAKTLQILINLHSEYAKPLQILAYTIKYYQIPFKYCKYLKFKVGGLNIISIVFEAACNSTNVEHGDCDCWHNTGYYIPMGLPRTRCMPHYLHCQTGFHLKPDNTQQLNNHIKTESDWISPKDSGRSNTLLPCPRHPSTPRFLPFPPFPHQPLGWGRGVTTRPFGCLFTGWLYEQTSTRISNQMSSGRCSYHHFMNRRLKGHEFTPYPHHNGPLPPQSLGSVGCGDHASLRTPVHGVVV